MALDVQNTKKMKRFKFLWLTVKETTIVMRKR